jgi:Flp pilus assembly protein TadB
VSKERQRRRAAREAEVARAAAVRERKEAKRRRRRERVAALTGWLPRPVKWGTHQGRLADRRRRRQGLLIAAFLVLQVVVFLLSPSWYLRIGVLVLSVLVFPVVSVLVFGRASG